MVPVDPACIYGVGEFVMDDDDCGFIVDDHHMLGAIFDMTPGRYEPTSCRYHTLS